METLFTAFLSSACSSPSSDAKHDKEWDLLLLDELTSYDNDKKMMVQFGDPMLSKKFCKPCELPFQGYFKHHLTHIGLQRRMCNTVCFDTKCSLSSIQKYPDFNKMTQTRCCSSRKLSICKNNRENLCQCLQNDQKYHICKDYQLFITDMESTKTSCSWNISFIDDAILNCNIHEGCDTQLEFVVNGTSLDHFVLSMPYRETSPNEDEESLIYETDSDADENDEDNDIYFETFPSAKWDRVVSLPFIWDEPKYNISKFHKNCFKKVNNADIANIKKSKHVHFAEDSELETIYYMFAWDYAYRQSRKSSWMNAASNRFQFQRKIKNISKILEPLMIQKLKDMESI